MPDTASDRPWLTETVPVVVPDVAWEADPPAECDCDDALGALCDQHAELILELI